MDRNKGSQRSADQQRNEHRAAEADDRRAAEGLPGQRSPRTTTGDENVRRTAQRAGGRMSEFDEASEAGVRGTERDTEGTPRTRQRRPRTEGVE